MEFQNSLALFWVWCWRHLWSPGPSKMDFERNSKLVLKTLLDNFAGKAHLNTWTPSYALISTYYLLLLVSTGPALTGVHSASLQHTAFQMGSAVVKAVRTVKWISLKCPNIHNIPVDFSSFRGTIFDRNFGSTSPYTSLSLHFDIAGCIHIIGHSNTDESGKPIIFWATKEPFGIINVTVSRTAKARLWSSIFAELTWAIPVIRRLPST